MSIEQPRGTSPMSDPDDLIKNSNIKIYYNNESESIESIAIESKEGEKIPLFPMKLESGEEYIPNFDEYLKKQESGERDNTPLIHTLDFEEMEKNVFRSVRKKDFDRIFLQFAKNNLSFEDYSRFIIEQRLVEQIDYREWRYNNMTESSDYWKFYENPLVMRWPKYYPGNENYNLEFLPTTNELYPSYLFNKLAILFENRERYNLKNKMFNWTEIKYIQHFIQSNYEVEPTEIFTKIVAFHNINEKRISHFCRYLNTWEEILYMDYKRDNLFTDLDILQRYLDSLQNRMERDGE